MLPQKENIFTLTLVGIVIINVNPKYIVSFHRMQKIKWYRCYFKYRSIFTDAYVSDFKFKLSWTVEEAQYNNNEIEFSSYL